MKRTDPPAVDEFGNLSAFGGSARSGRLSILFGQELCRPGS